jgi:hypothetical protein
VDGFTLADAKVTDSGANAAIALANLNLCQRPRFESHGHVSTVASSSVDFLSRAGDSLRSRILVGIMRRAYSCTVEAKLRAQ